MIIRKVLKTALWATAVSLLVSAPVYSAAKKPKKGAVTDNAYKGKGGETKEVTVEGMADIGKAGEQEAFDRALQHAMRKAVEQVLGSMVKSSTLVNNGALIEDKIYSKSAGFVQKYTLLDDSRKGNTKLCKIQAWVVLGDVKQDAMALGLLQDRVGRPKVMITVNDPSLVTKEPMGIMRTLLQSKMIEKEFQFVDEEQMKKVLAARNLTLAKLAGKNAAGDFAAAALDAGAQILITGNVAASEQSLEGLDLPPNYKSAGVTMSLNVLYAADASILASESKTGKGAGLDLEGAQKVAIGRAMTNKGGLADSLIDKIIKQWDNMVNNGFEYTVIIVGVSEDEADGIKDALEKSTEGVKKVFDKGYESGSKRIEFTVRYTGMMTQLRKAMRDKEKFKVSLETQTQDSRSVTFKKGG
ncbi:MAG: hypothetical protein J0L75_01820 [Spirochaetes bacterium]|nr:hypothetical protein [Spirochaetota bacterium]